MRLIPLLLRVLLCVAFLANGVAGAQAAVRMATLQVGVAAHVATQPGAASCHGAAPTGDAAAVPNIAASPYHGDGCKDVRCDGLCAPPAVHAPEAFVLAPAAATTRLRPRVHDHGRAPPRLPHELRPPIG